MWNMLYIIDQVVALVIVQEKAQINNCEKKTW